MAEKTLIAWTDRTFNPWMGCTKVSQGCRHCYAETLTKNRMGLSLWGPRGRRQVTGDATWGKVKRWDREAREAGKSLRVFTGSLLDVFEDHPVANETRTRLWDWIRQHEALDFQLLTKQSAAYRTEIGIELDGEIVREYPIPRRTVGDLQARLLSA